MKPHLVIATGNENKVGEFREALSSLTIDLSSAREHGITRLPPEMGTSYEENALLKAGYVALRTGLPSLGDDSGLEVDALEGAPGLYSARYGGKLSHGERLAHLLAEMRKIPRGARGASFICVLTLALPSGGVETFRGECRGEILQGPRGEGGFGYDPVFFSPELGRSFAEATPEEKRRVSHRGRAVDAFLAWTLTPMGRGTIGDHAAAREP